MPMDKQVIGQDQDGNDVVMVWGADLNWAHGYVTGPKHQQREYYRAMGKGDAHYLVARTIEEGFRYWYVTMHIDGKTQHLPTEFMSAYEGQEVCQIFEAERDTGAHTQSLERTRARVEDKRDDKT